MHESSLLAPLALYSHAVSCPAGAAWDTPHGAGEDPGPVHGPGASNATEDAMLVARAARGDRAALARLYDRYALPAYSLATRLVGGHADDVVHDAFVALLDRPSTFDPSRGSFRAWFLTTIHHRCLTLLRGQSRLAGETALAVVPDAEPEPADAMVQRLRDGAVRDALQRLPAPQREVIVLAYYGGLTQTMLAERLETPLGTIKARMRRGMTALRALLQGEAAEHDEEGAP